MKQKNTIKHLVFGVSLICIATASAALTLGRARGAVLLGQPLSLVVAIQAENDEAATDLCFDADVYYGDTRQEASRVSVVAQRQESGAPNSVRVSVAAPVDEPMVTVYLRSGCGQKTSRKYVLLPDLASDVAPPLTGQVATSPARASQPFMNMPLAAGGVATSQMSNVKPPPSTVSSASIKQTIAAPKLQAVPPSSVLKPSTSSKPRLKLSTLDLLDIQDPSLKISNALGALPNEAPLARESASALWRALNTSPQDVIKIETQQKALMDDLKSLRDLSVQNQKDLQELSGRYQQAESQRYANPLVYGLGVLLLMAGLALVVLFARLRGSGNDSPWWRSDSQPNDVEGGVDTRALNSDLSLDVDLNLDIPPTPAKHHGSAVETQVSSRPVLSKGGLADSVDSALDIDLDLGSPAPVNLPAPQPVKRNKVDVTTIAKGTGFSSLNRDMSQSVHASLHAINTQEMLDVRQQADFFMTLGQHEDAINLLESSIDENEASNPLVYLDLLKVLHTLSRKPAFDHFRSEFNTIFSGQVQPYATFGQPGNSLDEYSQICNEICGLWGTDAAVDLLEQCMVRMPEDAAEMYFDLDAFRDLLLLHAVASRIRLNQISDSGLMPFSAVKMATSAALQAPDVDPTSDSRPETAMSVGTVESAGQPLAVDLDLSSVDHNMIDFDAPSLNANLSLITIKPSKP